MDISKAILKLLNEDTTRINFLKRRLRLKIGHAIRNQIKRNFRKGQTRWIFKKKKKIGSTVKVATTKFFVTKMYLFEKELAGEKGRGREENESMSHDFTQYHTPISLYLLFYIMNLNW